MWCWCAFVVFSACLNGFVVGRVANVLKCLFSDLFAYLGAFVLLSGSEGFRCLVSSFS